jgi:ribonuclease HII
MNSQMKDWVSACIIEDDEEIEPKMEVIEGEKRVKKEEIKEGIEEEEIKEGIEEEEIKEEIISIKNLHKKIKKLKEKGEIITKDIKEAINDIKKPTKKIKESRKSSIKEPLKTCYLEDNKIIEIGVDEAGRGPLFGPVYVGAVVLPKDNDTFEHNKMKDSKRFHSKKKIEETAEYIKSHAIAWAVEYEDETVIDAMNILQATQQAMHKAIQKVLNKLAIHEEYKDYIKQNKLVLLIDGNYFKPMFNKDGVKLNTILVEKGDNTYTSIAAASILAKVSRDQYITDLCDKNPELAENYGINGNMGYGAAKHMEGIKTFGITKWHRRSFGPCKDFL